MDNLILGPCIVLPLFLNEKSQEYIDGNLALPLEFQVRDYFGASPKVDTKLKIVVMDDVSVSKLGQSQLAMEDWTRILVALDQVSPEYILIDKIFADVPPLKSYQKNLHDKEIALYVEQLKKLKTKVYTALFSGTLSYRTSIAKLRPDWFLRASDVRSRHVQKASRGYAMYGADSRLLSAFNGAGHINFGQYGFVAPIIQVGSLVVPHLALAGERLQFLEDKVYLPKTKVTFNRHGKLIVNFVSRPSFEPNMIRLSNLIEAIVSNKVSTLLSPGDRVLMLPGYFTGSSDFFDTPIGLLNGGLYNAAILNSTLTEKWIHEIPGGEYLILAMALLCLAICWYGTGSHAILMLSVLSTLIFSVGSLDLTLSDTHLPWMWLLLTVLISGGGMVILVALQSEKRELRLRTTLGHLLPSEMLDRLLKNDGRIDLKPKSEVVSILFLDIANFSSIVQDKSPEQIFNLTSQILNGVIQIVHKYGGIVDKTMGDGVLAYFGYTVVDQSDERHVDRAFACALEIQQFKAHSTMSDANNDNPYAFRIGINTAPVAIGNIGQNGRIDITLLGEGVNFAQRLESACDEFKVLLSGTSLSNLSPALLAKHRYDEKIFFAKHNDQPQRAYEFEPFFNEKFSAVDLKRKFWGLKDVQKDLRVTIDALGLKVFCSCGAGRIVDASDGGLGVVLDCYLGTGSRFEFTIVATSPGVRAKLEDKYLDKFYAEVRWATKIDKGFFHGIKFVGHSEQQRNFFSAIFEEELRRIKSE